MKNQIQNQNQNQNPNSNKSKISIDVLKERVKKIKDLTPAYSYFHSHPKLQAANNLLNFALESIENKDPLQVESSIKCATRYIEKVEKMMKEDGIQDNEGK